VRIFHVERKSKVLTPSSLACLSHIPTINLTTGCAHGCIYCYTRGYSVYPGENKVAFYANTFSRLRDEILRKKKRPETIYFSPSSDIFQPVPEVLELGYKVMEFLLSLKIGVAFLTKGRVPLRHMRLLCSNPNLVRAQIGLISVNKEITKRFEPRAAAPSLRLSQAKSFVDAEITTQVRVDPVLPGITDSYDSLDGLCMEIADAGVKRIAASVLFLRPAIVESLRRNLHSRQELESLLRQYEGAGRLSIHAEHSSVIALPIEARQTIYQRLRMIAEKHGLTALLCNCKNPDLASDSCSIAGAQNEPIQRTLFS